MKLLTYFLCDNICSANFLAYHNLFFEENFSFIYSNAIFKDRVLFK